MVSWEDAGNYPTHLTGKGAEALRDEVSRSDGSRSDGWLIENFKTDPTDPKPLATFTARVWSIRTVYEGGEVLG